MLARRYVGWLALLWAVSAWGDVRKSVVTQVAQDFRAWAAHTQPPDDDAAQEQSLKAYFDRPDSVAMRMNLQYEEYLALRAELNARHGYRLGKAPISAGDFQYRQVVAAARPWQWKPGEMLERQEAYRTGAMSPNEQSREERQRRIAHAPSTSFQLKPRLPHYYYLDRDGILRRVQTPDKTEAITVSLNQRGDNAIDQAMELIAATESGRQWLDQFHQKWLRGEVAVRPMDDERRTADGNGYCEFDEKTGQNVIYVDPLQPVGELATVLLHEMVHAVKREHRTDFLAEKRALREAKSQAEYGAAMDVRQRGTLRREQETHEAEARFILELMKEKPEVTRFFVNLDQKGIMPIRTSDKTLIVAYQLHRLRNQSNVPIDLSCPGYAAFKRLPTRSPLSLALPALNEWPLVCLPPRQRLGVPWLGDFGG